MAKNDKNITVTATIVLYKENSEELSKTIESFLNVPRSKKLFLVDNSPTDILKDEFEHPEIEYIYVGVNIGFGAAHNEVIPKIRNRSNYHLILNPDVTFQPDIFAQLTGRLDEEDNLALISPKVLFPNGKNQYTSRRYPTFSELIVRRLSFLKVMFPAIIKKGEYRDKDLSRPFYPDFMHGCFLLFKTEVFVELNGFDERYFLYMEDVDICKKLDEIGWKKLYFPHVEIVHVLKKKSLKSIKLFFYHIISVFQYFYKWHFKKRTK